MVKSGNLLSIMILTVLVLIIGCSKGNLGPTTPQDTHDLDYLPVGVSSWNDSLPSEGSGFLGLYELEINPAELSAELVSLRKSALTDILEVVDITNFLMMAPCTDCAKVISISLDEDSHPVVRIGIRHPFEAGDLLKPISGRNRGDLHVFNVEGIIVSDAPVILFPSTMQSIADFKLINADGYTGYLDGKLDLICDTEASIHPYITFFDDYTGGNFAPSNPMGFLSVTEPPPTGNLVMAMGCDYDYQDFVFDINDPFECIFAIGCTYAVSAAKKNQRFTPEFRIPQHNKKSASEITIEIISNELEAGSLTSSAEIEIHVVDINHGVIAGTALNEMLSDSSVDDICIDIPGITLTPVVVDGNNSVSGSGHDQSDPLVYIAAIQNTASADTGTYAGLVKISDNYPPGLNESPLLNGMDGIERVDPLLNPLVGLFDIPEFATYQIFSITVSEICIPPIVTGIDPDTMLISHGIYDDVTITGGNFTGSGGVTQVYLDNSTIQIYADDINVISDTELTCDFDISLAEVDFYDVVVITACEGVGEDLVEITQTPEEWVCSGYNYSHLSYNPVPQSVDPLNLTPVWENTTSGSPNGFKTGAAVIAEDKVFFCAEPAGYVYATVEYSVYAVNLSDGVEIWRNLINQQNEYGRALSSPFYDNGKIYATGDQIYCFDAETGDEIWHYNGTSPDNYIFLSNSPIVVNGRVFCTSRSYTFVCVDANDGTELWTFPYEFGEVFPASDGECVYFASFDNIYCCNCETGTEIWSQPIPEKTAAWSAPVIFGDRLYQVGFYGALYCFDKSNGDLIWTYDITSSVLINSMAAPFIDTSDNKPVFVFGPAINNNALWAIKDEGTTFSLFWVQYYGGNVYYDTSAITYGDYVLVTDKNNKRLLIVDKLTGDLTDTFTIESDRLSAQPSVAFDRLVILGEDSVTCYM